ncbi:low molecular weight protein-tyrosine-phosphatase [uncultured Dechloromonas sp.]|uniref:low molecular weight protein-tyrosine-phosphatase n=1 Tax=uncultured Dechloromonas sp. TaxID=171719 RepID=UPI0025FBFE36|nr:low molecular weight protein-tyrosine-phosphatase [uncultured Dechloromonas sp.]
MFKSILTVCTGNICRSPAAEYFLRDRLARREAWQGVVQSAGVAALDGRAADETTQALMLERGIDLGGHRGRQLTVDILRKVDLVLVMEKYHRDALLDIDPAARGKTFLLGHWMNMEIADPYRRGREAHGESLRLIDMAIESWLGKL